MRKETDKGVTEFPVSPEDVATALAARATFSTGLILPNTLYIMADGARRTIVEYRPPQKTTLWFEGSEDPIRVPLPGLLMVRTTNADQNPNYRIHAVTERPLDVDAKLYRVPLPNIGFGGDVCWGTVTKVNRRALASNDLSEDWAQLLGTPFGNHSATGKTKTHSSDVRKFLLSLEKRKARVFPKGELIAQNGTLGSALGLSAATPRPLALTDDEDLDDEADDQFDMDDDDTDL